MEKKTVKRLLLGDDFVLAWSALMNLVDEATPSFPDCILLFEKMAGTRNRCGCLHMLLHFFFTKVSGTREEDAWNNLNRE